MRTTSYLGYVISGTTALALLAGCSGGGSLAPAAGTPGSSSQSVASRAVKTVNYSVLPPNAKIPQKSATAPKPFVNVAAINGPAGNQVIVSDYSNNNVTVFGGGGAVNATLTSGLVNPQGLTTDASGTLYVANTGASNILLYPKPYTSPSTTLNDANEYPVGISYDPTNGEIAVSNIFSTSGGAGSVSIFAKGATTPCVTVGNSNWSAAYFAAFDKSGNVYVDGHDNNGNTIVGEVTGGCSATTISTLSTGNAISFPGGIQVLSNGDVAIDDQLGAAVYTYAPASGGSLGSPVATTSLSGASDPVNFAIKAEDHNLWTADAGLLNANKYGYPAGGSPSKTFTNNFQLPIGVAVNPAQVL